MYAARLLLIAAVGVVAFAGDAVAGNATVHPVAVALSADAQPPAKKPAQAASAQKKPVHNQIVRKILPPPPSVSVAMDNVALVSFKAPVSSVYVGNPSIAELTVIDAQHVYVLGKRFGATNLIALGPDKSLVVNEPVMVSSRHGDAITVFRGSDSFNYVCTGFHCEARPVPGDPKVYFDNAEQAASEHEDAGNKAAGATGGSSQQGH